MSTPAKSLSDVKFPDCAEKCAAVKYFGVCECESICPHKFKEEENEDT